MQDLLPFYLFVCLLAFPTSLGAPLRERQERFIIIVLTVCEQYTENLSSNRKKIALKTVFKLITIKANIHRVLRARR